MATETVASFNALNEAGKNEFFDLLVKKFAPNPQAVGKAGADFEQDPTPQNLERLRQAVQAPRQDLFHLLNMAPEGTATLVRMRGHLLRGADEHPEWAGAADDLAHLFLSWFNRGFLELHRIDWNTSAAMLEKLIRYEAVHEIQGWSDLRRRLEADRRCYAFLHPALPDEPIVFIEVGLTHGMEGRIQSLVDPELNIGDAQSADCAMFYSITNCHAGLTGVPFGSFLIKQVVEELSRELPKLRRFATLSPVPGFRRWLATQPELAKLNKHVTNPSWSEDRFGREAVRDQLEAACAYYLIHAKKGGKVEGKPLDPVARFHLRNGASLDRINWLGDPSSNGLKQSAGLMVNYVYRLREVERNHESYTKEFRVVASSRVDALAKRCPLAQPKPKAQETTAAKPEAVAS